MNMRLLEDLDKLLAKKMAMEDEIVEDNVTGNMDGGAGPPKVKGAFSKSGKEDENNNAEVFGYKKKPKSNVNFKPRQTFGTEPMPTRESAFKRAAMDINEISYKDYKNDPEKTPHNKINTAIKEINSKLFEIERIVARNVKLKSETGVSTDKYWKPTRHKLHKISERMLSIAQKMRELNA